MKAYVVHKGLSFNQWSQSVNHCLFDYRTTPHSTTNCRPVDIFLAFKAKGYMLSDGCKQTSLNDIKLN